MAGRLPLALLVACASWLLGRRLLADPAPAASTADAPVLAAALRADDAPTWHREMKCEEKIPPSSVATAHDVEVFAESFFVGRAEQAAPDAEPEWLFSYRVQFRNHGKETVQMLTRHWVFVDALGRAQEVMGPGARGHTPVLTPGARWTYESGASLATAEGSMRGSFGFVRLGRGPAPPFGAPFPVRVARLALSSSGKPVRAPCGPTISAARLPTTSVALTHRVLVGATSALRGRAPIDGGWRYELDVQVNNVRDEPIVLVGREWRASDLKGEVSRVLDSGGRGWLRHEPPRLKRSRRLVQPGASLRFRTTLAVGAELSGSAVASGHLLVCLAGGVAEAGHAEPVHEDVLDALCQPVQVEVGRLALSPDGGALVADDPGPKQAPLNLTSDGD